MVEDPLVSVVVPIFNRRDLLMNTLKSVKCQTFSDIEVLLIDDASEEIFNIKEFEDFFEHISVTYHKLKINGGPGKARSIGRNLAKGKYIAYLDSDDLWESTFLEKTVAVLKNDSSISMVFTNVLLKRKTNASLRLSLKSGIYDFFDLTFETKIYWATGAALWKNDISLSSHWYSFRDHEDYVHDILSLINKPKIYHIEEALCIVNKNEVLGISRSNTQMLKSLSLISKSKKVFQKFSENNKKDLFLSFVFWRLSKRHYRVGDLFSLFSLYINLMKWSKDKKDLTITFLRLIKHKLK
ncbi:glycosyltransferase family A protein [Psychroserpens sp. MEBiC05023]